MVVLSKKKADFLRVWEKIREAYESGSPIEGTLVRKIKGGMTVDLMGVDAFLPGSQIALRRVPNIEDLVGDVYDFKIIKLNKRRRNIVVSRRVILEAERGKKRRDPGQGTAGGAGAGRHHQEHHRFRRLHRPRRAGRAAAHHGHVLGTGGTPLRHGEHRPGAGRQGARHRTGSGSGSRSGSSSCFHIPGPISTSSTRSACAYTARSCRSRTTARSSSWRRASRGSSTSRRMSWTRNIRHPSKLVSIADEIEAVVLKVDPAAEKISLGMKQIEEDPWLALPLKYPTGTRLQGKVRNLTSFGAFVEIEPGIDGLVHVSDMSWTKRVEHPSEIVNKGQELEVMVLDVDGENKRISLGIKQVLDDPWPWLSGALCTGRGVRRPRRAGSGEGGRGRSGRQRGGVRPHLAQSRAGQTSRSKTTTGRETRSTSRCSSRMPPTAGSWWRS